MDHIQKLTVADWRDLYEGMTQEDPGFREKMAEQVPGVTAENILSELELAQNRLTYAMMGIHPIYQREIELSGIVNYPERCLALYADNGERIVPFQELDPSYVEFLENQKRVHNVKDVQPLSSIALRASQELYPNISVEVELVPMNTDGAKISASDQMLRLAWARSTILMNHLHEEMEKSGIAKAYGVSRGDLQSYCISRMGDAQFDRSVKELGELAEYSHDMDHFLHQA